MLIEPLTASTIDRQPICQSLSLRLKNKALTASIHVPANIDHSCPPLLALHGISRNAAAISASFAPTCLVRGQVLIVPRFSRKHWPHYQQIGRVRADKAVLELMSTVQSLGFVKTGTFDLFGYSGGAQLAHRFAMLYPNRINTLHVAAAGWYCVPNTTQIFPMGLGLPTSKRPGSVGSTRKTARLQQIASLARVQLDTFLKLRFRIYVGDEDETRDPALRQCEHLDLFQGKTRRERARNYAESLTRAAHDAGITPDVVLSELPGCVHSFSQCAAAGMTQLVCR
jgi:pimeloyl-ACP methyl ester carboxylesterase